MHRTGCDTRGNEWNSYTPHPQPFQNKSETTFGLVSKNLKGKKTLVSPNSESLPTMSREKVSTDSRERLVEKEERQSGKLEDHRNF